MVTTTRYSVIFQKFPSRVRVAQKILSSIRVAGTRWGLATIHLLCSANCNWGSGANHCGCWYISLLIQWCKFVERTSTGVNLCTGARALDPGALDVSGGKNKDGAATPF